MGEAFIIHLGATGEGYCAKLIHSLIISLKADYLSGRKTKWIYKEK